MNGHINIGYIVVRIYFFFCYIFFFPFLSFSQNIISNDLDGFQEFIQLDHCSNAYQDQEGFIWLATDKGLVRFDGVTTRYYKNNPNDSNSIASNNVFSIASDQTGNLWLSLPGEGIDMFDIKTNKFFHFREEMNSSGILLNTTNLFCDSENKLWFGTQDRDIAFYDLNTKRFTSFRKRLENLKDIKAPLIAIDFEEDIEGNIWIAQYARLTKYDRASDSLIFIKGPFKDPYMVNIEIDSTGKIWVGDKLNGIFSYHPQSRKWDSFDAYFNHVPNSSLERIDFFELDIKDHLRAIDKNGIHLFTSLTDSSNYQYKPFLNSPIWFMDKDENQYLINGGIFKKDAYSYPFHYLFSGGGETYWSNGAITFADKYMIFALLEKPLIVINIETKKQVKLEELFPEISHLTPKIIFEDSRGNWWIGDFFPGKSARPHQLYKFNPMSRKLEAIENKRWSSIGSIAEDKNGIIWVGSWGGLAKVDPNGTVIRNYFHDPINPNSMSSNAIRKIMIDSKGMIWIATNSEGLNLFNPKKDVFKYWKYDRGNLSSISSNYVLDIFEDSKSRIWVGTQNGLNFLLPDSSGFKRYLIGDSQNYRDISSIEEDDHGALWLGSSKAIIRFRPETGKFREFDQKGGIYSYKNENGYLYFGNTYFHPDSIYGFEKLPLTYLDNLKVNNNTILSGDSTNILEKDLRFSESLRLNYNQNFITLEFSSIYHQTPKKLKYQYQLLGFDDDWQDTENLEATYSHLSPQKYTFLVRSGTVDGFWGPEQSLIIIIHPPFWRTWWAYICYLILIIGSGVLIFSWFRRRWELKSLLESEHQEAIRLKKLNRFKNKLFTNVTHEFRTPLTIILGITEQLKENPKRWFDEGLQLITRSGNDLLRLINQMLDISKLETGIMPIQMMQGNLIPYLKYMMQSFHSLAQNKSVELIFSSNVETVIMDYDPEKIREICSNLFSNAIKFSPKGGIVEISSSYKEKGDVSEIEISVKDYGQGIANENIPFIFDRFYTVKNKSSGTGIGLALTRELVLLLGGKISVESTLDKGSEFTFVLPVSNLAPLESSLNFDEKNMLNPGIIDASIKIRELESISYKNANEADNGRSHLLLVEDNTDMIRYIASCLQDIYNIDIAKNGREGLEKAIFHVPDIILSDVMMPEMDGLQLLQALKKDFRTSHIPIVLLTAKVDLSSRMKGLEFGADAYMSKPFYKPELLIRLHKLIESRKHLQDRFKNLVLLPPSDRRYMIEDAFVKKIYDILMSQLDNENFDIHDLCKELSMSRTQLYRKFKTITNHSIGHYFKSLRIEKAKELLKNSDMNISEITYKVGLNDPAYFSRVFKKETGIKPKDFRDAIIFK